MKIHYEPHPVSPERKAELRKAGFKILDARFAPDGWQGENSAPNEETASEPKRRGRPRKAD